MKSRLLCLFSLVSLLGLAGCNTATQVRSQQLLPVVIVSIDSTYDSPNVIVNGFNAGPAPRDIYLEVNEDGTLPYAVNISVDPSGHSDARSAAMLGSTRGPQVLTKSYGPGRVPARRLHFSPVVIREDGQATVRAKPGTSPTAREQDTP